MMLHKYLLQYIIAVYGSWVSLVGGIGSVVLLALLAFWGDEWTFLRDNKKTFVWLAIICLIVTGFSVWLKERKALEKEQAKNGFPEIGGKIKAAYIYNSRTKRNVQATCITLIVSLVNKRPAVATIDRYELIILVNGLKYPARLTSTDNVEMNRPAFDVLGAAIK